LIVDKDKITTMARKSGKKSKKETTQDKVKDSAEKETAKAEQEHVEEIEEDLHEASEDESSSKGKSSKKDKKSDAIEWQEKAAELNDKFLRLYSEFDNFRKRTAKEKIEMSKTASEEVIMDLLTVLDDFERAIKSTEESKDCDAVKEGMNLIFSKFKGILEKKGLKPIKAIGEAFDTDFHEAITYIPAPSDDLKGKVVDEVEKGYLLGEKVIRYTKVVIGQNE
jgi:molecular chaperone GrpE